MKTTRLLSLSFLAGLFFFGCAEAEFVEPASYSCQLNFPDESSIHPKAGAFQAALDRVARNTPGVTVALKSADGLTWNGVAGKADIPNNVNMEVCHKMMIGSISKVFTATMIFKLQDQGLLSIDDPLTKWIDASITSKLENADRVNLTELLNHTSGLADYNDTEFTLDAINKPYLKLSQEEKLEYAYGLNATNAPGARYTYSNTNFVLLGMVVEKALGIPQAQALERLIFDPLGLRSGDYGSVNEPIPSDVPRPYVAIKGGKFVDLMHVEVADANTGDGGVAINMQELRLFFEGLFQGKLLSDAAFTQMTQTLTEIPEDEADFPDWGTEFTGYGIDIFQTPVGEAYGHTGGIFGFNAVAYYYPESGASLMIAYNGAEQREVDYKEDMREELMRLMFD